LYCSYTYLCTFVPNVLTTEKSNKKGISKRNSTADKKERLHVNCAIVLPFYVKNLPDSETCSLVSEFLSSPGLQETRGHRTVYGRDYPVTIKEQ